MSSVAVDSIDEFNRPSSPYTRLSSNPPAAAAALIEVPSRGRSVSAEGIALEGDISTRSSRSVALLSHGDQTRSMTLLRSRSPSNQSNPPPPIRRPLFGEGSIKSSIFNLTNATLGAGIVSVPYAMKCMGLGAGLTSICLLAYASTLATRALVRVVDLTEAKTFEEIGYLVGGKRFAVFVEIMMMLFNFGAATGYLICIGDIFTVVASAYQFADYLPSSLLFLLSRHVFVAVVAFGLLLPLSLVDRTSRLRLFSLVGLAALETLVVVTAILLYQKGPDPSAGKFPFFRQSFAVPSIRSLLEGVPLLVFAFSCHSNVPSIYCELENQNSRRMSKVARRSAWVALATYSLMGLVGLLLFGTHTEQNVLSSFTADLVDSRLILVPFIGMLIGVALSYPMCILPCRAGMEMSLYWENANSVPRAVQKGIVIFLVVASMIVSVLLPSLAMVFSLTGASCGACVAFIFPGIFSLYLLPANSKTRPKALGLVISGLVIAVVGTTLSLMAIFG